MSLRADVTGKQLRIRDLPKYAIGYLCWLTTAASTLLAILLIRNSINLIWPALGGSRWVLRPIDRFGLVLMGLGWLVFVLFLENYYRTGVYRGIHRPTNRRLEPVPQAASVSGGAVSKRLRRMGLDVLATRFARTLMVPVALAALSYVAQQVVFLTLPG